MHKRSIAALLAALISVGAHAVWPEKTIRIVVPYPPGGSTDIQTRLLAQKLAEVLRQPVLVDNRAGGAAMIGSDFVAKSAPDGYTLLSGGAGPQAINVSLFPKIPYDPIKDFAPVTLISILPLLMVAPASLPVNTAQEYIAWARQNKDKANFCSISNGSPSHLTGELFKSTAGLEMTHIPYSGSGPAIIATIAGTCSVLFDSVLSSGPHVKSGKLKVLATAYKQRLPSWPGVPSLSESGMPGFDASTWGALYAPAGTPHDVIDRLQAEVARILALPDVRQRFEEMGALPGGGTTAELDAFSRAEMRKWAKIIKDGNIKAE